jgi:hypothetical protein
MIFSENWYPLFGIMLYPALTSASSFVSATLAEASKRMGVRICRQHSSQEAIGSGHTRNIVAESASCSGPRAVGSPPPLHPQAFAEVAAKHVLPKVIELAL